MRKISRPEALVPAGRVSTEDEVFEAALRRVAEEVALQAMLDAAIEELRTGKARNSR
jgi:hypothetical protein